jgi:D-amino-acid oxidase
MNTKQNRILVIGAGVSGLTTALHLLQAGHSVTIYQREPQGEFPHTSHNAYAMWVPVMSDVDSRVETWANKSLTDFLALASDPTTGVALRKIVKLKTHVEEPWFAKKFAGFRHAHEGEIPSEYPDAHILEGAPIIDPTVYLPWLRQQVLYAGGVFEQNFVQQLSDCSSEFQVIVNCTGLGSRELVGDTDLHSERVQVLKIKHNGLADVVIDDEGPHQRSCLVPHGGYVKVGAVFDGAAEGSEIDPQATADILERARLVAPGFTFDASDIISVTRAYRPERSLTRVEKEQLSDGRLVVHNYGHDGMGYILSHGIAAEITGYIA